MLAAVHDLYVADAAAYARLRAPLLRPLARRLVAGMGLADARLVVDVGCGAGTLLPDLAGAAPRARVVGVDGVAELLALAGDRHPRLRADAAALPLREGVADGVVLAFVLFHLGDPAAAVREAARVLRVGGRLGVGTWARDVAWPAMAVVTEEHDRAGAPAVPSTRLGQHATDEPGKVVTLLDGAGVVVDAVDEVPVAEPPDLATFLAVATSLGATGRRHAALPPAERERVVQRVAERLAGASPAELREPSPALLVTGRRGPSGRAEAHP